MDAVSRPGRGADGAVADAICRCVVGRPVPGAGAEVANHGSWLDIFVLNAGSRVYFVSKAEVAGWPVIGRLARAVGTIFIRRDRRDAAVQARCSARAAEGNQRLLFFPEGTSSDCSAGSAFQINAVRGSLQTRPDRPAQIQPVTVVWPAPPGAPPRFYGWWGDMGFGCASGEGAGDAAAGLGRR